MTIAKWAAELVLSFITTCWKGRARAQTIVVDAVAPASYAAGNPSSQESGTRKWVSGEEGQALTGQDTPPDISIARFPSSCL